MLEHFEIKSDSATLDRYATDASIFRIIPKGVFAPKSKEELHAFVRRCIEEKSSGQNQDLGITARAAGTCMSGGSLTDGYVIDFSAHLNKLVHFSPEKRQITVEPGMYYRDMEKITLEKGLILPSYPASRELCAVGGMVGNNAAGEKTFKYGKTDKYVESLEMICEDGNVYTFQKLSSSELQNVLENDTTYYGELHRHVLKLIQDNRHEIESNTPKVTKNSSGYALWDVYNEVENSMDLTKLIVGSQGTLGIVTEITFRLIENPKHSQMAVVLLKDIKDMSLVVGMVKPILPESFEVFDDHTFKISMKFLPQIISRLGGGLLSLGLLFWPEIKLVLTGSIPKIVMLIEFVENTKEELDAKIQQLESVFETWHSDAELHKRIKTHIVQTEREAQKYWVFRRESFNLLRSKLKDVRTAPFIEDVVVRSEDLPEFLPRFEALLDEEKLIYTIAGHVGDGNIHVIPLMNLKDSVQVEQIMRVSDKTYELIKEYHGSLSGEHNDGLIRSPFLQYMFSEKMIEIFSEIKHIFDKKDLFNPHKKIGITWDYAQSKIDRRK